MVKLQAITVMLSQYTGAWTSFAKELGQLRKFSYDTSPFSPLTSFAMTYLLCLVPFTPLFCFDPQATPALRSQSLRRDRHS